MTLSRPNGFVELEELVQRGDEWGEWEETARWITLEETVESDRWSKPHVPCLSLEGLQSVREILQTCPILIDIQECDMVSIVDVIVNEMVRCGDLDASLQASIVRLLLLNHRHKDQRRSSQLGQRIKRHFSVHPDEDKDSQDTEIIEFKKDRSLCNYLCIGRLCHQEVIDMPPDENRNTPPLAETENVVPHLLDLSESTTVLVGTVNCLRKRIAAFVRLSQGCYLGNLMEVNVPVRFLFVLLVPDEEQPRCKEVGRSLAAMMCDKTFLNFTYKFQERNFLLRAVDEFLDGCVVIPPGEWDRQVLLQTIPVLESQSRKMCEKRKRKDTRVLEEDIEMVQGPAEDPLERTGRFCGGLVRDVKRRVPQYFSDFTDAFDIHCLAAIVFVYIASLAPAITFGGILSQKTGGWIGVTETILATSFGGVLFALFAGQPLTIISFTGPLVVFEKNTYEVSESFGIEYLPFRAWIGIWVMAICFFIVAFEGCFLVRFFTRFTEEIFACLIAFTFVYDAVNIVVNEYDNPTYVNTTVLSANTTNTTLPSVVSVKSSTSGHLALLLVIGTFLISYMFRRFRHSHFFGHLMRRIVSDFGVLIAILAMVWYCTLDDNTTVSLLTMPDGFQLTKSERTSWLINPMGSDEATGVLTIVGAIIPAVLVSILIFMEVELTGLILDKKEFKLKKGTGYNLDLVVVGIVVGLCSLLGFPWMCASPIHSVSHVQALMVFSHRHAPGERPELIEIKEQRVTNIIIHILIGISAILAPALRFIPIPVLAGVLLYLGICSLSHIQLCERIKMLFQPPNHHPDVSYVLGVKTNKMHLFTLIQTVCVCLIILIKLTPLAPFFPFLVLCLIPLRKLLKYWFTEVELELLDNEEEEQNEDECDEFDAVHVPI